MIFLLDHLSADTSINVGVSLFWSAMSCIAVFVRINIETNSSLVKSAANNGRGTGRKPVPFSAADAVIIGANGTMAGVWILILLPMFRVAVWVSAKKRAIRRKSV